MKFPRQCAERRLRLSFRNTAFSLIELLAVMAAMTVLMVLVVTAFSGRSKSSNLTKASYDISGALEVARTYATANNTYVWVGFFEENISQGNGVAGIGRIVVSTVASKDGTSIYNRETAMATPPVAQPLSGTSLVQVGNVQKINNVHLVANPDSGTRVTSSAFSNRPGAGLGPSSEDRIGAGANYTPLFPFKSLVAGTQYTFGGHGATGVVQFDPQGEAITDSGPVPGVRPCKEIAIQSTHGTAIDASPDIIAIDIAGMTGAITIYRK